MQKEERKKTKPKPEKKGALEKNIDFNSGFDHGFGGLAEYVSDEDSPKPKTTSEQQKGTSVSAPKQPEFDFNFQQKSEPQPQPKKEFNFDDFLSSNPTQPAQKFDLPDVVHLAKP